jgi:exosome complex exonuclease RRP6
MTYSFGHPYLVELNRFEPSDSILEKVDPILPKKLEDTPLVNVSTARELEQLLRDLYAVKEFSVDLEHHSYRSFLGLTCLMQISTREKDYVIDGFTLRDQLHLLNDVFTDPKIVKVNFSKFCLNLEFHNDADVKFFVVARC